MYISQINNLDECCKMDAGMNGSSEIIFLVKRHSWAETLSRERLSAPFLNKDLYLESIYPSEVSVPHLHAR
jgi:hypothetical protein